MDINGTESADTYDQSTSGPGNDWHHYFGKGGNDTIRMYQGTAIGGPGNDTIEALVSTDWWRRLEIAFWDSPGGINVDLAAGWADDGWGTRDTLIGVIGSVHGSWRDDIMRGSARNDFFWPNGGKDTIDGRGGNDVVGLGWQTGDPSDLSQYNIVVSLDGVRATITSKADANLRYELSNIEKLSYWDNVRNISVEFDIGSFIKPIDLATQGLVAASHQRWNSTSQMGTAVSVTYSFVESAPTSGPGATGFRAFSVAERQLVRDILNATSAVTGLTFSEVAETGSIAGQLRLGVSAQAATKGLAYLPDVSAANATAGDIWMDTDSMIVPTKGSEGYAALLHEIGHALGLRHPRNVDDGDAWVNQFRPADDRTSLTVMSGTSSADGLYRADWGLLDIAALQYLYGRRTVNAGDTVYLVGSTDARAQRTIEDDGGADVIDASASSVGVSLDLRDGRSSSVGVTEQGLAPIDNLGIAIGTVIENAVGSATDDFLQGNGADNRLTGGLGNDWVDGAEGQDTAGFAGQRSDYFISNGFGKIFVAARDGISGFDTLLNIEKISFSDATLAMNPIGLASDMRLNLDQGVSSQGALPVTSDLSVAAATYSKVSNPAHGTVTVDTNGRYSYAPDAHYFGEDIFSYRVSDANGQGNSYFVYINLILTKTLTGLNLFGTPANESFSSGVGNDAIDGGGGTDTALYSGKITDYFIKYNRALGTATITDKRANGDGTDTLKSIEKLQFADKTFDLLNPARTEGAAFGKSQSFLFDPAYYLLKHPDLVPTVTLATAFNSYKTTAAQGAAPNAWFDPVYYANRWADLKPLNLDAVTLFAHYNLFGVWEGRSAGPSFDKYDGTRYLKDNPDVAAYVDAYVADFLGNRSNGAIAHYVIYGAAEGRVAYDTAGVAIDQAILIGVPGG